MPITLSKDLVLKDSKMELEYTSLYNKLNKAISYKHEDDIVWVVPYATEGDNVYCSLDCDILTTIESISDTQLQGENSIIYTKNEEDNSSFRTIPDEASRKSISVSELLGFLR